MYVVWQPCPVTHAGNRRPAGRLPGAGLKRTEPADRDYRLVVLADACADPAPGVHDFLTEKIFPRQAHVTTTARLATLLSTPDPPAS
jgi:hypothetical protein